jgi:glucose-6-phosphate isomerase
MKNRIESKEWQRLVRHQSTMATQHMRDWFRQDTGRTARFSLQANEISLDYSRNRITEETISLLCDLAYAFDLPKKIKALFTGEQVNFTENRPALHTALRHPQGSELASIASLITQSQSKLRDCVEKIHTQKWLGVSGKPIEHVVNIGIGGSHLGPMMTTHALKDFAQGHLQIHYISSIDDSQINEVLQKIAPETTLFIVSSKSFSTLETLTNARTIAAWMKEKLGSDVLHQHFIAITAATEKALEFGIAREHIFPMWDWVGGRYSIWSAIGLPLMLLIGNQHFADFLQGAHEMDCHFRHQALEKNIPVLLALLSIWYMNFFDANVQAIVPYAYRLRYLIPYLQQADMESNGKQINSYGQKINYASGPVLFGGEGSVGQHAYHQLLHQGQHFIPVDFIMSMEAETNLRKEHQDILRASCLSQAQALMQGKTYEEAYQELLSANYSPQEAAKLASHQIISGNKPSNILFLQRITPKNLGALLAMYEHKIFVQSVIWDINPFDQWGVELGKQLLPNILRKKESV